MVGYSYFDYDQMTLLGIEVHSDELELLQQVVDTYDWKSMEKEVEPKFRESALDFRDQKHSFVCARKYELDEDLQESFPFLDEMAETEVTGMNRNPKRAGRNGQEFISYLKAFLLAPVLRAEQNSEAIAAVIAGNHR
ncbi:hypothetical protein ACFL6S_04075 [Candidatus Poribacteria bacterium]